MDVKYKSSRFATYSQYIAAPIIIGICLYYIYLLFLGSNLTEEEYFFLPFWVWASFMVIFSFYKLRYVQVTENNILMKSFKGEEILLYKDIEWISQNIFGSNWHIISIKYNDTKTGKSKSIFIFPEMYTSRENLAVFSEMNITKYIREQIMKANPSYNKENEQSRWYLGMWMIISLVGILFFSFLLIL